MEDESNYDLCMFTLEWCNTPSIIIHVSNCKANNKCVACFGGSHGILRNPLSMVSMNQSLAHIWEWNLWCNIERNNWIWDAFDVDINMLSTSLVKLASSIVVNVVVRS